MPVNVLLSPVPTSQIAVVSAFRDLLIKSVDDFNPNNVFITDPDDDPPTAAMNQRYWCGLWILGGEFDRGIFEGSGSHDVREAAGISLAVYQRIVRRSQRAGRQGVPWDSTRKRCCV